jgi:hypothetical protein
MIRCKHTNIKIVATEEAQRVCEENNNEMKKLIKDGVISKNSLNYPVTFDEQSQIFKRCSKCGRWWIEAREGEVKKNG